MFQQKEQQQYYEPYRQNCSFSDNGNNNRTDSTIRNNNTNENTLQHSNKDIMGILKLLTTGVDDIKKEINAIKVRLNNLEGKNTQTGTSNQTQISDVNKEKDKESTV